MSGSGAMFYTAMGAARQWRQALAVATISVTVGGCGLSFPLTGTSGPTAQVQTTGAISGLSDPQAERDIVAGDRGIIASTLAAAPATDDVGASTQLAWTNPKTGNQGTIFEIVDADPKANGGCRRFSTTANTIAGVRNYSGIACPDGFNTWHVTVLQPADADI